MVIDPEIIKGIRKVVFLKTEPQQDTDVLWAKGEGGVYEFYLFFDGQWHSCDDISNITISSFDGLISSFINDAEYLTKHQDISGKADKSSVYTKTETDSKLGGKQDTINDLTDIRNGASKGATSLQPDSTIPASHVSGLATVATSGSYNDLSDKPTNVSAFTNDAGYVTADLTRYKDVYIGVAAVSTTVISSGYHHDNIVYGKPVTFSNASGYIWAVLPAEYEPTVAMSLMEVPMALDSTTTIDSKSYKIWKSMNQYSGTFKLYLF